MPILIPPTGADVLPSSDANFDLWGQQFQGAWVPATFNVILPSAVSVTAAAADFTTKLLAATDPTTRTSVTIAAKEVSRTAASVLYRAGVRAAQAAFLAGTATEPQLNNLGVRANSLIRTPIGQPVFAPILTSDGNLTGQTRMRITQVDPSTGVAVTTRRFALGITGVEVQRKVGAGEWLLRFSSKRTKLFDLTNDLSVGTVTLYRARYYTARGLTSPWSLTTTGVAS